MIAVIAVIAGQDAKPPAVFMVHKMLSAVGLDAAAPLPVALIPRARGLQPVVFAVIADAAVGRHDAGAAPARGVEVVKAGVPARFFTHQVR